MRMIRCFRRHVRSPNNDRIGCAALRQQYLAIEHVPCPACSYDLHGIQGEACPECGDAIRIGIVRRNAGCGLDVALIAAIMWNMGYHIMSVVSLFLRGTIGRVDALGTTWFQWHLGAAIVCAAIGTMFGLLRRWTPRGAKMAALGALVVAMVVAEILFVLVIDR